MKTLRFPLKKEWYNMIESGVKPEEYRLLSYYWIPVLLEKADGKRITRKEALEYAFRPKAIVQMIISGKWRARKYDYVKFSYGYTSKTMTFTYADLVIAIGNPAWGAPDHETFIIKFGKRIFD